MSVASLLSLHLRALEVSLNPVELLVSQWMDVVDHRRGFSEVLVSHWLCSSGKALGFDGEACLLGSGVLWESGRPLALGEAQYAAASNSCS